MQWTRIAPSSWAFLALVISFSATGRRALALASVVTIASAANSEAARLAIISRWCAALPPKARERRGVGMIRPGSAAQREAALVELHLHLVQALLPEVGDVQQVVLGLGQQLTDGVDLRPLEAVARTLGQVELLDRQVEVRRAGRGVGDLAELEPLRLLAQSGNEI